MDFSLLRSYNKAVPERRDNFMLQKRDFVPAPRITLLFTIPVRLLLMLVVFTSAWWPMHAQAMTFPSSVVDHALDLNGPAHVAQPTAKSMIPLSGSAQLYSTALLTATLAVNAPTAIVGNTLVYTLTLVNNSSTPEAFSVTDTLPDSLMLIDAPNMRVNDQMLTADGILNSGTQQQFVITTQIHLYQPVVEHEATVRFGDQTQIVAAPVVRMASPGASSMYYLPLMIR